MLCCRHHDEWTESPLGPVAVPEICYRHQFADVYAILGSLDIVFGKIDR